VRVHYFGLVKVASVERFQPLLLHGFVHLFLRHVRNRPRTHCNGTLWPFAETIAKVCQAKKKKKKKTIKIVLFPCGIPYSKAANTGSSVSLAGFSTFGSDILRRRFFCTGKRALIKKKPFFFPPIYFVAYRVLRARVNKSRLLQKVKHFADHVDVATILDSFKQAV